MWEGVGDWTKTATYWPPQPLRTSPCVVLVLLDCSTGGLGAQPLWKMFPSQHLLTNWSPNFIGCPKGPFCWVGAFSTTSFLRPLWTPTPDFLSLTELYNSSITHSIWHVCSSSSGNNCHAVHRSLSSGASVYECTMGFLPCHIFQPARLRDFLLITAIRMCHFLPVHHYGMACLAGSNVNIRQKYPDKPNLTINHMDGRERKREREKEIVITGMVWLTKKLGWVNGARKFHLGHDLCNKLILGLERSWDLVHRTLIIGEVLVVFEAVPKKHCQLGQQ